MALSELDRNLLARCLSRKPRAWEDFVDRFMGLVMHVINHSAHCRSIHLTPEDREDLAGEVFFAIVKDDFSLLRNFRGESSLATYLTVVTRRIVVHNLMKRKLTSRLGEGAAEVAVTNGATANGNGHHDSEQVQRLSDRDEIERLLGELEGAEAEVVRMYHLEGKTYSEISSSVGMPENSVGPTLTRARQKMRRAGADPAVG